MYNWIYLLVISTVYILTPMVIQHSPEINSLSYGILCFIVVLCFWMAVMEDSLKKKLLMAIPFVFVLGLLYNAMLIPELSFLIGTPNGIDANYSSAIMWAAVTVMIGLAHMFVVLIILLSGLLFAVGMRITKGVWPESIERKVNE
jgi:hypothetical protein